MIRVSVPGKVMLAGEYGVLQGGLALSCTVEKRVELVLDTKINSNYPQQTTVYIQSRFAEGKKESVSFVLEAENSLLPETLLGRLIQKASDWNLFQKGKIYDFKFESSIPLSYGIGSSSAIALAFFAGILQINDSEQDILSQEKILAACRSAFYAQWLFQKGKASGYDILSQCSGGLVRCQCFDEKFFFDENFLEKISQEKNLEKISSLFSWPQDVEIFRGYGQRLSEILQIYVSPQKGGAPTLATITKTSPKLNPSWHSLGNELGEVLLNWILADSHEADRSKEQKAYEIIKKLRYSFKDSPSHQFEEYQDLSKISHCDQTWSFKASGAGGKDALILFGKRENRLEASSYLENKGWMKLDADFSESGLEISFC